MRRTLILVVGLTALLVLPARALAGGPPTMAVQHTLTNGVFARAEWYTQTTTRFSDVAVNVVRQRHGSSVLDLAADYQTLDSNGLAIDETFIVSDTTTGFTLTSDPTGLGQATLVGRVPVTICTHLFVTCNPGTASVTVRWTGSGPITRGAITGRPDVEPGSGALYLFDEHLSGSSRTAVATGTLNSHPLTTPSLASATIGTVRDGTIFVCLNDGCEN